MVSLFSFAELKVCCVRCTCIPRNPHDVSYFFVCQHGNIKKNVVIPIIGILQMIM